MLKARLFPPTPEELLAEGVEESARSREAAELSKQLKSSSKVGLVLGSAARGVKARVWDRDEDSSDERGGALARGLGGSAMLGGLAGGLHVDADAMARARRRKEQPPSAMARALMGATSTAGGVGGGSRLGTVHPPTPPVATSASSTPPVSPPSASRRSTDGDISLYRLVKELGRVAGPSAQQMLADGSDLGEKIKK